MDKIKLLSEAMVGVQQDSGEVLRALRIGKDAGNRLLQAAMPLAKNPAPWEQPVPETTIMGIRVVKAPDWWPPDLVGMQSADGKWHYVRIGGGDDEPV